MLPPPSRTARRRSSPATNARKPKNATKQARVWICGLEAVKEKIGVKAIYDLSATPFFLRGSGYGEGTLFPWVVSDFSLIDAIECGIVKVPRVPVADDSMAGEQPTYRDLWLRIRDDLPKKGRKTGRDFRRAQAARRLEGACTACTPTMPSLTAAGRHNTEARDNGLTPPVFIVVCNNTNVSKMVFDYIAGWEKPIADGDTVAVPGKLPIFSNVEGRPVQRIAPTPSWSTPSNSNRARP